MAVFIFLSFLVELEQRLGFYDCHLVRVRVESMQVQLISSCLEVDIAKRLKSADSGLWKSNKDAAMLCETLKIDKALAVEIRTHLLDLKISHVAQLLADGALVVLAAPELELLDKATLGKRLSGKADQFGETLLACKNTDDMRAAGGPDSGFVLLGFQMTLCVNVKQLRMQRPLKKSK